MPLSMVHWVSANFLTDCGFIIEQTENCKKSGFAEENDDDDFKSSSSETDDSIDDSR